MTRREGRLDCTGAAARAAHLIVDRPPLIFADTSAAALLGDHADDLIRYHREHGDHPVLDTARAQVLCRSWYAEDRLAAARIPVPPHVTFVPAEFGADPLAAALRAADFDVASPAVLSWLGVTMYLDAGAITGTLAALSGCAPGTEIILDYMLPGSLRDQTANLYVSQVGQAAADRGEPWRSFLSPGQVREMLEARGFAVAGHVRQSDSVPAGLWARSDPLRPGDLSMIIRAVRQSAVPG